MGQQRYQKIGLRLKFVTCQMAMKPCEAKTSLVIIAFILATNFAMAYYCQYTCYNYFAIIVTSIIMYLLRAYSFSLNFEFRIIAQFHITVIYCLRTCWPGSKKEK